MGSLAWDAEILSLRIAFPKFEAKHYTDSKLWGWLKSNFLSWAAATTVGYTVYFDDAYYGTDRGAEILKHESVHIADGERWGFLFKISYILFLPTVFTMRAYWEWRAYKETLRSVKDEFRDKPVEYQNYIKEYYCQFVASQFSGVDYFFMFPFETYMYNKCVKFYSSLP